ncbi:MAG: rhomboid family intramembrane serine protease [Flavobacteriaceae bacterium]|nr:rhomboid family intramembrane serine protease [Candidatus Onthonaster equi]
MGDASFVTILVIGLNILFSWKGFNDISFFDKYKFQVGSILNKKEHYRILSSGFLHVDFMHLFFNMYTLYIFAEILINFFASPKAMFFGDYSTINMNVGYGMFLLVYIASVIGGNILSLFMYKNQPYYTAVGASGGVSGILFAAIAAFPELRLGLFFIIPMPAWIFAILYLGYSVYGMKNNIGNIGHAAHLGGAVVGLLATILYYPQLLDYNLLYIAGMTIPLAGLGYLMFKNK